MRGNLIKGRHKYENGNKKFSSAKYSEIILLNAQKRTFLTDRNKI